MAMPMPIAEVKKKNRNRRGNLSEYIKLKAF